MLNKLMIEYENKFKEEIELLSFLEADEEDKIKILKECIAKNKRIFENEYFNKNYMERVY